MDQPSKSALEVAVLVIAGLIDCADRRAEAMAPFSAAIRVAVGELVAQDPPGRQRDTRPTWWQELDPWEHLDAVDRLRLSHDQLVVLEEQAGEIVMGLRSMLTPHAATGISYRADYRRLRSMGERRSKLLERIRLAERRLRPKLTGPASAGLRATHRALVTEETRGNRQQDRLAALLSMPDLVAAS